MDFRCPVRLAGVCAVIAADALLASAAGGQARFQVDVIDKGRQQFHRTCSQCHGNSMVTSGAGAYDLRRFPVDDPDRFFNSVTNGKGGMPSFKEALTQEQMTLLWAYVASRGGKEP